MKNVVLIGMPGTGKSTVGVILAKRLGCGFLDTDILLAETEKRRLSEIIEQEGYDGFIELEGRLGESVQRQSTVIATGGSMVFSPGAMENLKRGAVTVWLDTPAEELQRRIAQNRTDRGVAAPPDMTVDDILAQRRPLYEKYADIRIECVPGTDNVVNRIRDALEGLL